MASEVPALCAGKDRPEGRFFSVPSAGRGDFFVDVQLAELLHENVDEKYLELLGAHTFQEMIEALSILQLVKEHRCGYNEVAVALRTREIHNAQQARYREMHREEVNKKEAARKKAMRQCKQS